MIKLLKIDEQGFFIEDVIVKEIPMVTIEDEEGNLTLVADPLYIQTPCPGGFHRPRWDFDNKIWIEGLTQEEIDAIVNVIPEQTLEEKVAEQELVIADLMQLLVDKGVIY